MKYEDEFKFVWEERWSVHEEATAKDDCAIWYVPLQFEKFKWYMEKALTIHPEANSFLDVGSGVGDKVKYMEMEGFKSHGIELSGTLINKYEEFQGLTIFQENILDFEHYGDYDIVYIFNPMPENPNGESTQSTSEVIDRVFSQYRSGIQLIIAIGYTRKVPSGWFKMDCQQQTSDVADSIIYKL